MPYRIVLKDERPTSNVLKDERPTSNIEHRILNKVFCQFINRRSGAISLFDVGRSMFDVHFFLALISKFINPLEKLLAAV